VEGRNGGEFKKAEGSMAKLKPGRSRQGHGAGNPDLRRLRLHPRLSVEKWHRDAKIYTLFEGTSEIQRIVISRALAKD